MNPCRSARRISVTSWHLSPTLDAAAHKRLVLAASTADDERGKKSAQRRVVLLYFVDKYHSPCCPAGCWRWYSCPSKALTNCVVSVVLGRVCCLLLDRPIRRHLVDWSLYEQDDEAKGFCIRAIEYHGVSQVVDEMRYTSLTSADLSRFLERILGRRTRWNKVSRRSSTCSASHIEWRDRHF